MEIFWYTVLFILAITFSIFPNIIKKENTFYIFWLSIATITSVVVRTNGFDSDITDYALLMKETVWTPYYLREPFGWLLLRSVYSILQSKLLTFIFIDFVFFILLYKGIRLQTQITFNKQTTSLFESVNIRYLYFSVFLFFPFMYGFQVIYRQYMATILFICAFGYASNKKMLTSFFFFILSMLTHNVSVIFLPLILYISNIKALKFISYLVAATTPIILYIAVNFKSDYHVVKSNFEIGETIDLIYVLIFFSLSLTLITLTTTVKNRLSNNLIIISMLLFYTSTSIMMILASSSAERFGFFMLAIIYPLTAIYFESIFKEKVFVRIAYILLQTPPLLFYYKIPTM